MALFYCICDKSKKKSIFCIYFYCVVFSLNMWNLLRLLVVQWQYKLGNPFSLNSKLVLPLHYHLMPRVKWINSELRGRAQWEFLNCLNHNEKWKRFAMPSGTRQSPKLFCISAGKEEGVKTELGEHLKKIFLSVVSYWINTFTSTCAYSLW